MAMLLFFANTESLKTTQRKGWVIRGIENGESVADHMHKMGLICLAYPWESDQDRAKAVEMAIIHDVPEAIAGDITPSDGVSREAKHLREALGLKYLCCLARQGNNAALAERMQDLWDEYERAASNISKIVHQIDKLEALQQAFIYTRRYPTRDLSDFKAHRSSIYDPWLAQRADEILAAWSAFEARKKSDLPIIFVIGGPGVGKGTQCRLAAEQFDFEHISVGELLRQEGHDAKSFFGDFITESMRESIVVPATLTIQLLEERLNHAQEHGKAGVLLDGFPRSAEQLRAFREQITTHYATILLDCSDDVLHQRLSKRAKTSGRLDDASTLLQHRIQSFRKGNKSTVDLLADNLTTITCDGSVEEVYAAFQNTLQDIIRGYHRVH